jgi:hypothetical protein
MERVINDQLLHYLSNRKLITKNQHGFLGKRSACTSLLECINDWTLALEKHKTTDIAYIDFQKAADSVSHPKLIILLVMVIYMDGLLLSLQTIVRALK